MALVTGRTHGIDAQKRRVLIARWVEDCALMLVPGQGNCHVLHVRRQKVGVVGNAGVSGQFHGRSLSETRLFSSWNLLSDILDVRKIEWGA